MGIVNKYENIVLSSIKESKVISHIHQSENKNRKSQEDPGQISTISDN